MKERDEDMRLAFTASAEELKLLVYHPSSKVISKLILNNNLTEDLALIIASRKNIDPKILESLYNNLRWKESYHIMLTLSKNPKTPQKISLSLINTLRIFDLADLTRDQRVPISLKKIYSRERSAKLLGAIQHIALRKLRMLNNAQNINDLRTPPSNRLEKLGGNRAGQYSIRINDQWRICFIWKDNNAFYVEITDYH